MLHPHMEGAAVQHRDTDVTLITPSAPIGGNTHGGRAKCLQRLTRLKMPVPPTVALSFRAVHGIAAGGMPDLRILLSMLDGAALLCVRPSSEDGDWGGPRAVLNIGMSDAMRDALADRIGPAAATRLYLRFIESYAIHVARLDPDMLDDMPEDPDEAVAFALRVYLE
jgi:pyruvate,orthophosphate dikinase